MANHKEKEGILNYPSFPFYVGDYRRETEGLTHCEKGVFTDLRCSLHDARIRGTLTDSVDGWARRLGVECDQVITLFSRFENVGVLKKFMDSHGQITVDYVPWSKPERHKESAKKRQTKHRLKKKNTENHANVTPQISIPSSSLSSSLSLKEKEKTLKKEKERGVPTPFLEKEQTEPEDRPLNTQPHDTTGEFSKASDIMRDIRLKNGFKPTQETREPQT